MKRAYTKLLIALAVFLVLPACLEHTTTLSNEFSALPSPTLSIDNIPAMIRGNYAYQLHFAVQSASALGMESISVEYAADGVSFTTLGNLAGNATQYSWTTPAQDITSAKLRVTAMDTMGRKSTQVSSPFTIRNSPPQFTLQTTARQLITNQSVTYSGSCDTNFTIQAQITGQQPFQSQNTFQCINGQWTYTFTPTADNIYNFAFTETDPVGHTSNLAAVTLRETTAHQQN